MTDLATPGEVDAEIDSTSTGHAVAKAGTGAWIVDGSDIADVYSSLDESALNAFDYNTTDSSGLDVVIDPGEAYVGGWLCRDSQTTVSLDADATTTVYVGYDASAVLGSDEAPEDSENVIVGPDGDFASEDHRTAIWEFETDADSVTDDTNLRQLQKPVEYNHTDGEVAIDGDVTVDGGITLDDVADFNSTVEIAASSGHLDLVETDEDDKAWRFEAQGGQFQITEVGVATQLRIDPDDGGRVEHPNGGAFGDLTTFNADVDMAENRIEAASNIVSEGYLMDRSGYGLNLGVSGQDNERPWIAPYTDGESIFSDELTYRDENWVFETQLEIDGNWAVTSNSQYEVQKDGSDGNGVINFKTS